MHILNFKTISHRKVGIVILKSLLKLFGLHNQLIISLSKQKLGYF